MKESVDRLLIRFGVFFFISFIKTNGSVLYTINGKSVDDITKYYPRGTIQEILLSFFFFIL